jgi:hypothetical protein
MDGSGVIRNGPGKKECSVQKTIYLGLLVMAAGGAAGQAVLQLQEAQITETYATVPISVRGTLSQGVASLNFELRYDPDSIHVVSLTEGDAAQQAGKHLQWHQAAPGHINVVLMGFTQQTIRSGEVARLTVESLKPDRPAARLEITKSTFASIEGNVIPSRGSSSLVTWDSGSMGPSPSPGFPTSAPFNPVPDVQQPQPLPLHADIPPRELSTRSQVPDSVQQRLTAARHSANTARATLGPPRRAAGNEDQAGASDAATPARVASGPDAAAVETVAERISAFTDADAEDSRLDGTGTARTPKIKLENVDQPRHNESQTALDDGKRYSWTPWIGVGVAAVILTLVVIVRRM